MAVHGGPPTQFGPLSSCILLRPGRTLAAAFSCWARGARPPPSFLLHVPRVHGTHPACKPSSSCRNMLGEGHLRGGLKKPSRNSRSGNYGPVFAPPILPHQHFTSGLEIFLLFFWFFFVFGVFFFLYFLDIFFLLCFFCVFFFFVGWAGGGGARG